MSENLLPEAWTPQRVREHAERLRNEADINEARVDRESTVAAVAGFAAIAKEQIKAFASLPCLGSLEHVSACSDAYVLTCKRRTSPSCPREIRAFEAVREREELLAMFAAAEMPRDAVDVVLDSFRPTEATMAVDRWLADKEMRTLVLAGSVGVGKTVAAAYAMKRRRGFCRFVSAGALTDLSRYDETSTKAKHLAYACGLLVVDDLGTEYGDAKGWFQSVLDPLLVDRHGNKRRTIVTSNLDTAAFAQRYGERIADRIAGSGMFVPFDGPSLRGVRR